MKIALAALCLSLVATEAHAISTYNPTKMACATLKSTIRQEGAVFLRWTSPTVGVPRYGRYVRDSLFCRPGERAKSNLVPARDKKYCSVYECRPYVHGDDDFF